MSDSTIAAKSLEIRNETQQYANTRGRVADVLDDINATKISGTDVNNALALKVDKPLTGAPDGLYWLVKSGSTFTQVRFNPTTNRMLYWNGTTIVPSDIRYNPTNGTVGIGGNPVVDRALTVYSAAQMEGLVLTATITDPSPIAGNLRTDGMKLYWSTSAAVEKQIAFMEDINNLIDEGGVWDFPI